MSIAPGRNPVPKQVWRAIRKILAFYGVEIMDKQIGVIDPEACEEYATFAVLYTKETQ